MGSHDRLLKRGVRSHGAIRLVRLPVCIAPFLLHQAAVVQGVCGLRHLSSLNPIFKVTWNSATAPFTIFPRSSTTSNHSMFRSVFAASATAALVASAKLWGEVPTSSVILYIPAMLLLLGEFALRAGKHFNLKTPRGVTRIASRCSGDHASAGSPNGGVKPPLLQTNPLSSTAYA